MPQLEGAARESDCFDADVTCVLGERRDVGLVAGENRSARLSQCHHDGVDRRTLPGPSPNLSGSSSEFLGDVDVEDASLQEAVQVRVASCVALERLNEDHGGNDRRPELRGSE